MTERQVLWMGMGMKMKITVGTDYDSAGDHCLVFELFVWTSQLPVSAGDA